MPTSYGKVYLGSTLVSSGTGYRRPSDWLTLTDMSSTEGFCGLHAVWNDDANFCAFTCAGDYTVDWGDGSSPQNFSSGATAYRNFAWADYSSSTLTSRGYRQALVTVTPQAGQTLTSINLTVKHNQSGLVNNYTSGWLDLELYGPNLTSLAVASNASATRHRILEQCTLRDIGSVTSIFRMFQDCRSLQNPLLLDTSSVTSMSNTFLGCGSLVRVPLFDTSSVTDMSSMFSSCGSLLTVPLFDTSSVTNMSSMFFFCSSLARVPAFNTSSVTNMSSMFRGCPNLQSVPLLDSSGAGVAEIFSGCTTLQSVPAVDMSASTSFLNAFASCTSLSRVEATGISKNVSFASAKLSAADLDEIYTNLADLTGLAGQTITVTGNYGTAGDDTTIATNKNWTVTG
jgi:surface protein